jgi:hypothetical protein
MHARRLLTLLVISALLPLTACTGSELAIAGNTGLDNADWPEVAGRDLNCAQGARLIGVERHDITGDGKSEAFVVMRCKDPAISADQLEVFDGAKRATDLPIAVLTRNWTDQSTYPLRMEHGCVSMVGAQVIVRGRLVESGAEKQKVWTWTNPGKKDSRLKLDRISDDDRTDLFTTLCFGHK